MLLNYPLIVERPPEIVQWMIVILVVMLVAGLVVSIIGGRHMEAATTYRQLIGRFFAWFGSLTLISFVLYVFSTQVDELRRFPLVIFAGYLGLAWAVFSAFFVAREHVGERRRSTVKRTAKAARGATAAQVPTEPAPAPIPKPSETKETTL